MSEEVKRPDLLIYAMKHALPGTINPVSNAEQAHHIVKYIESLESKLKIAEEALEQSAFGIASNKNWNSHEQLIESVNRVAGLAQQALAKIRG